MRPATLSEIDSGGVVGCSGGARIWAGAKVLGPCAQRQDKKVDDNDVGKSIGQISERCMRSLAAGFNTPVICPGVW